MHTPEEAQQAWPRVKSPVQDQSGFDVGGVMVENRSPEWGLGSR